MKQLLQINTLFLNSWFVTANLLFKKEKEILWHTVTSLLFGRRMRADSSPRVNKINSVPLCFNIWMWGSSKDTFSVFCKCFHKCIHISEEQQGVRVLFSLQTLDNVKGLGTFLCHVPSSLWTLPIWSCLLSWLQMYPWKWLNMPSCLMCEPMHSPFIIRRQTQELNVHSECAVIPSSPKRTIWDSLWQPQKEPAQKKCSQTAKLSMGLWWSCNGPLGKIKTRKCDKPTYECA